MRTPLVWKGHLATSTATRNIKRSVKQTVSKKEKKEDTYVLLLKEFATSARERGGSKKDRVATGGTRVFGVRLDKELRAHTQKRVRPSKSHPCVNQRKHAVERVVEFVDGARALATQAKEGYLMEKTPVGVGKT